MVNRRQKSISRVREARGDQFFYAMVVFCLSLSLLVVFYPLVFIISSSFSDAEAVIAGRVVLFPINPSLEGYKAVFDYNDVWIGYLNTIFYTFVGTAINVFMTILIAYPLSRKDFVGRNLITFVITFTLFFNGGLIPTYLVVNKLGILNTRWAMLLPGALAVWNVIITRTFFQHTIPSDLYDAATIDGCSNTRMLISVVLPLSMAILAVITLFYSVGHWNSYFSALIYLKDKGLRPLQIVLREVLLQNQLDLRHTPVSGSQIESFTQKEYLQALLQYSLIIVATLPVMVFYPFVQKYFVRGVMIGAIKG